MYVFAITDWHVWLTVAYLHFQQIQSNTIIHLDLRLCRVFTLFLLCFWSPPTPERNILVFSRWMLHYVDQLVSDCVYLYVWVKSMLYQYVTEDVKTFSTFNTWSSCTGWYFTEQTNALLNSNQKRKKRFKSPLVLCLKRAVGLAAFCMAVWYGGTKGTPSHDKPFPWGDFFFYQFVECCTFILPAWNLACLFFFCCYRIACWSGRALWLFFSAREGRSNDVLQEKGHNAAQL